MTLQPPPGQQGVLAVPLVASVQILPKPSEMNLFSPPVGACECPPPATRRWIRALRLANRVVIPDQNGVAVSSSARDKSAVIEYICFYFAFLFFPLCVEHIVAHLLQLYRRQRLRERR